MKIHFVYFQAACRVETKPDVTERLGGYGIPSTWTADLVLDTKADGADADVLGGSDCAHAGFATDLAHGIHTKMTRGINCRVRRAEPPSPA